MSHIRDFEFIVTGSEKEALLLEINLIKKHTPPYNIMFMDDKTYPYIEITKENNFVVRTTRNIKNKKSEYFGPYPSSQSAYEIVRLINQIFCVRKCRHIPDSPCLYYHMHQCLGPCIHEIDPKENEMTRKKIKKFLQGDTKEVMDSLQAKMMEASENLQFEKAQEIYNTIQALEHVIEKQTIDSKDRANRDVFGYYVDSGYISFQGFFIRQGKLLERNMSITPLYEDEMDAFTSFIMQYYEKNVVPKEILVPSGTPVDVLKEALNTNVHIPVRGEKKKLIDLVYKNAKEAHEQKFKLVFRKDNELRQANEMLSKIFNADIHTVEMFDNSHIQGTFNVSGLVVFKDGLPDKNSYRHYKLDGYRSDVDSMKEVIYRRYFRLLKEHLPMPDLLLVDGGAAQIAAAKEIIAGQCVARGNRNQQHDRDRSEGDDEAVLEKPQIGRAGKDLREVLQRRVDREEPGRHAHDNVARKQGAVDHPVNREQQHEQNDCNDHILGNLFSSIALFHFCFPP